MYFPWVSQSRLKYQVLKTSPTSLCDLIQDRNQGDCVPTVTHPVHNSMAGIKAKPRLLTLKLQHLFHGQLLGPSSKSRSNRSSLKCYLFFLSSNSSSWSGFVTQLPRHHNPIYFWYELTETKRVNFNDWCLAFLYANSVTCTMTEKLLKGKGFGRHICNVHAINTV